MFRNRIIFDNTKNKRFLSYTKMGVTPNPNFIIGFIVSLLLINERKR